MGSTLQQTYLMVSDLKRASAFYADGLGLPIVERGERSVEFETGSCRLKLEEDFDEATLEKFNLKRPGDDRGAGVIVVLEVDDVNAMHERAVDSNGEVLTPAREVSWGRTMFLVRDPDGYVLEVSKPTDETD